MLAQLVDPRRQQCLQSLEAWVPSQIPSDILQRARHVLRIDGVASRSRLESERAERLEVALYCHHVEATAELWQRCRRAGAEVDEVVDEALDFVRLEFDIGVAQQRNQIVGVGTEARVLEVDHVEA